MPLEGVGKEGRLQGEEGGGNQEDAQQNKNHQKNPKPNTHHLHTGSTASLLIYWSPFTHSGRKVRSAFGTMSVKFRLPKTELWCTSNALYLLTVSSWWDVNYVFKKKKKNQNYSNFHSHLNRFLHILLFFLLLKESQQKRYLNFTSSI